MNIATTKEDELVFFVNGRKVVDNNVDPETTLLQYLRQTLRLTGSKLGCGEGGCGACTVMVSSYDKHTDIITHYTVNGCLAPVCSVHGLAVTTVEGIGSVKNGLHPVQERLAKFHGSQCGFCTPGFVMSMYTLLRNEPTPCMDDIVKSLEGNLCRCTGYRPILDGFRTFSQIKAADQLQDVGSLKPYDPSQDLIFPPELQLIDYNDEMNLVFKGPRVTWFRPGSLTQLLDLKAKYSKAKIVVGNTEIGIEMRIKNQQYPVLIACTHIAELKVLSPRTDGVMVGSSVTLSQLMEFLKSMVDKLPVHKTKSMAAIVEMLQWFAGKQIRNVACIGGNIMTASPISDMNPLLCAAGAKLTVASKERGSREVTIDDKFFVSYRKTAVLEDEILVSIFIPFTQEWEYFQGFKQAHRRDDDIAIVNSGFRVRFKPNSDVIDDVILSFGGMAPTTIIARKSGNVIFDRRWDDDLLTSVVDELTRELDLPVNVPGGMAQYRQTLAISFFYKFYISVRMSLAQQGFGNNGNRIPHSVQSASLPYNKPALSGTQVFEQVSTDQNPVDPVGRPLIHQSAMKQVTGEAIYIDDMPKLEGELHLVLVVSQRSRAKILHIDPSKALTLPGVVDFIDAKDNPTDRPIRFMDQLDIFPTDEVICEGQILGAILADTKDHALVASRAVHVEYEELKPIVTIQDAIEAKSFFDDDSCLEGGDVNSEFPRCDHVIEGDMQGGGQEHFYMETHAALAVPREEEGMEVFVSSQNPTKVQTTVAETLGVSKNKVVCRVKRMGGGFGGKEFQCDPIVLPTVIAARKHQRSVRCFLERQEDMTITGGRNPFYAKYKVGFDKTGKIRAIKMEFYLNAGCILECSAYVLGKALYSFDNCYNFPNFRIEGLLCKTNLSSNTAFRGFGSPQMLLVIESILTDVAISLNLPQNQVREINMYKSTDVTFCNMPVDECHFKECWDLVLHNVNFEKSRELVNKYNRNNRWRKRGISIVPAKMPCGIFETKFMNQGAALVHVYTDGSVLLTCGGTEMGQGLFTKMIQVASRVLNIPIDRIVINETSTDFVPNTVPTAASTSADLNGFAVKNACETIVRRLQPFVEKNPQGKWEEWVEAAYKDMISLSATGFYGIHYDNDYDPGSNTGRLMMYCVCGVAYSEVEIDCLTGDHELLKTEIVMDVGKSLNPAVDVGQIEGAFIQGYGMVALEQYKVTPTGRLLTTGPGAYKIPSVGNIPAQFNVTLLKGGIVDKAVYSSKGLGETPIGLSMSVFFALKDAILSARADDGVTGVFPLNTPATPERIRMACSDRFTQQIQAEFFKKEIDSPGLVPFFVTP